jgi:SAM-dependent methyltransferase
MSFPQNDPPWAEAAAFLRAHVGAGERLLAPVPFREVFPSATSPAQARARPGMEFRWLVAHKGDLGAWPRALLDGLPGRAVPVFANAVFVVFCASPPASLKDVSDSTHVRAYHENLAALPPEPPAPEPVREPPPRAAAPAWTPGPMQEAAREVATRWWQGVGGVPGGLRARAFREETDRLVLDALAPARGERVLAVGGGAGRLDPLLPEAELLEAAAPGGEAAGFDTVVLLDALPDLPDVPDALAEAARVLRAGGRLLLTAPNRDGLAMRALRRLGLPQPGPAFSIAEVTGMLRAAGLHVVRMDGIMLSPGWALPGVDRGLGPLEEDPEFVEAERLLGRRAGPDYALAFALLARKG